jgi:hypothetical protein
VSVAESPPNDDRALAVITAVKRLVPNKPMRCVHWTPPQRLLQATRPGGCRGLYSRDKGNDGIHAHDMTLYGEVAKGWGSPYPVIR